MTSFTSGSQHTMLTNIPTLLVLAEITPACKHMSIVIFLHELLYWYVNKKISPGAPNFSDPFLVFSIMTSSTAFLQKNRHFLERIFGHSIVYSYSIHVKVVKKLYFCNFKILIFIWPQSRGQTAFSGVFAPVLLCFFLNRAQYICFKFTKMAVNLYSAILQRVRVVSWGLTPC